MAGCDKECSKVQNNGCVKINFAQQGIAATKSLDDELVSNVNIYLVDGRGDVHSQLYSDMPENLQVDIVLGQRYTLYAVANAGKLPSAKKESDILDMDLSGWITGEGGVPMSGVYGPEIMEDGSTVTVPLTRLVAKIVVRGDFSQLNQDVSIDVRSVRLRNVPRKSMLFDDNKVDFSSDVDDGAPVYVSSVWTFINGVELYQMENLQGRLLPQNTHPSGKVFPQGSIYESICSYVEIQALYKSDKKEGNVVYRFYLGEDAVSNFDVCRNTQYNVAVIFKGEGGVDDNSWRVDISDLTGVVPPDVEFEESARVMYDLEETTLPFLKVEGKGDIQVSSSDPSVVQVLGYDRNGVGVKALKPGTASVSVKLGSDQATCTVDVEKLRIVPKSPTVTLYNHFYEDIDYDICPQHASGMAVTLSANTVDIVTGWQNTANRVISQYAANVQLPVQENITMSLVGRSDVKAEVAIKVMPMLDMLPSLIVNANMGSSTMVKSMGLQCAPRAEVEFTWAPNDGISIYGDPGSNISIDRKNGNISFPVPNSANGKYRLKAKVIGDDGYGNIEQLHEDAVKYCDISVYETIYLVGVSKTMGKERVSANPLRWKYSNEVVAKWLSHPKSLLFPNGELFFDYGFVYKGNTYTDSHTEFEEEYTFTFVKGEPIKYALEDDERIFNGEVPEYYVDYFYLQPAVSPYINGNMRDGTKFVYIYSLQFVKGFSEDPSPDWEKIFDFIYR